MRLYLEKDVKVMHAEKQQLLENLRNERLEQRTVLLERNGIIPENVVNGDIYWEEVIGDYLNVKIGTPKRSLKRVVLAYTAAKRMSDECTFQKVSLLPYFIKYPNEPAPKIVHKALTKTKLILHVFNLKADTIASYLSREDQTNWIESNKNAEYATYLTSSQAVVMDTIKKRLLRQLPDLDISVIFSKYRSDLSTTRKYFTHPKYGVDNTVEKIVSNMKLTDAERQILLENEMQKWGLDIRKDSSFCKDFISGNTLAEVDEVAATMALTAWLFSFSHFAWSKFRFSFEDKMKELVFKKQYSWADAYEKITTNKVNFRQCENISYRYNTYQFYDEDFDEF
jgi:hypothetical protein